MNTVAKPRPSTFAGRMVPVYLVAWQGVLAAERLQREAMAHMAHAQHLGGHILESTEEMVNAIVNFQIKGTPIPPMPVPECMTEDDEED